MNTIRKQMLEISRLSEESDKIYHDIAQGYGLSDSIYWILYILYNYDEPISQIDLCKLWAYSKQTINTSVTSMIKREWITLETIPGTRNRKRIVLTEDGRRLCERVIGETRKIEEAAFSRISEEERELFISLFRRTNLYMREEYDKIHIGNSNN
ncbi:MAG: MarR family transcriptional regulator [Lachnospiraceae bacterium]|nr:MarR family transcriptional regulator [Ruminococcus sp.]MCM1276383.1 MarR family transcriptional regulator [Lachnospiraceae bacterium]